MIGHHGSVNRCSNRSRNSNSTHIRPSSSCLSTLMYDVHHTFSSRFHHTLHEPRRLVQVARCVPLHPTWTRRRLLFDDLPNAVLIPPTELKNMTLVVPSMTHLHFSRYTKLPNVLVAHGAGNVHIDCNVMHARLAYPICPVVIPGLEIIRCLLRSRVITGPDAMRRVEYTHSSIRQPAAVFVHPHNTFAKEG